MIHYNLTSTHDILFLINEIRTSLDWLVTKINALGDGVISDCFRSSYLFNENSSQEVIFLFLHVVAMLGNVVAVLGNIVTTLDGKMTTMGILLDGLGVV